MSRVKSVPLPCLVENILPEAGQACDAQETEFWVSENGKQVGNICIDHVHLVSQSELPYLKYGFANWQE